MYKLERNKCRCHPETCCCDDWVIIKNGEKFVTIFDKEKAEFITEALNQYNNALNTDAKGGVTQS